MAVFYKIYIAEAYGATSIVVCIYRDWGVQAYGATSIVVCTFSLAHIFVATMICSVVFVLVAIASADPQGNTFAGSIGEDENASVEGCPSFASDTFFLSH